jgi:cytochrome P450
MLAASDEELADAETWSNDLLLFMNEEPDADAYRRVAPTVEALNRFADALCDRHAGYASTLPGVLAAARADGVLDDAQVAGTIAQNVTGALGALSQLIVHGLTVLAATPDRLRYLRADPARVGGAVEEMLRYDCPFLVIVRQAARDVALGDTTVPAGGAIGLFVGAADRDPHQFPDPDTFDVTRAPNPHLAFGFGRHYCLGAALTRLVCGVAFETVVAHFERIERIDDDEDRIPLLGMRWLRRLPLRVS